jgi:hypothetical protein
MTKREKADATWKWLIHASREKMSLEEFTAKVNEHKGGGYEAREMFTGLPDCHVCQISRQD